MALHADAQAASFALSELLQALFSQFQLWQNPVGDGQHDLLDAVVNMKFSIAENLGISCSAHIDRDIGTGMPFRPADTSVLLGNLLDNALEAAAASERKLMLLNIVNRNESLYIIVSNTIAASVLDNNPKLQTSKPDKELHGFGTKNVNKIVRSYNGIINYSEDGDIFSCDILIPLLRS